MKPSPTAIKNLRAPDIKARVLAEDGKAYAVYLHRSKPGPAEALQLELEIPAGRYQATWIDPQAGSVSGQRVLNHPGGTCSLSSPPFREDIALKLAR
jgi:hypothetical protein